MKNKFLTLIFALGGCAAYSQVGIGTQLPHQSAQLEIVASDKGILIPRVELTNSTDDTTISNGNVNSLLVFNMTSNADIKPGYYYWYETKWNRIGIDGEATTAPGSVIFNSVSKEFLYINENGNNVVINLEELVNSFETLTVLVNNNDGTYTYTNEAGNSVTIDVAGEVADNFETIINNQTVQEILNNFITSGAGNVVYTPLDKKFSYVQDGVTHQIDLEELVKNFETLTVLVNNNDGTYTYTNEAGNAVTIDIAGEVADNFETIINNQTVQEILNNLITTGAGNVVYTPLDKKFSYVKDGVTHQIDLEELVNSFETLTVLVNNNDGTYTYTNEAGNAVTIDIAGEVADNFETIINNQTVQEILNNLITTGAGNVVYTPLDKKFSYVKDGVTHQIDLEELVNSFETVTVLVNNNNGTYTYTNEDGNAVTIDIAGDVADNFETIINNQTVKEILNSFITTGAGNVVYTPLDKKFSYVKDGVTHQIDLEELVNSFETVTLLVNNNNGTYTYTNEDGNAVTIDIAGDVADNFETIINNQTVKDILNSLITTGAGNVVYTPLDKKFSYVKDGVTHQIDLEELVNSFETVTILVNNNDGTYTYTNEEGNDVQIDIPGDVADNFQTIVNNQTVKDILNNVISKSLGNVVYDGVTKEFSYVNAFGDTEVISLEQIVENAETLTTLGINAITGKLDFKDEKAIITEIDLSIIVSEPWFSTTTNKGATTNLENIYTNGWVGIGYDTPSANPREKLRVNGTVTTVNSTYADYVFEDYFDGFSELKWDYKFKSLSEIEDFIKTNKHLPGITPIHELEKTDEGYSFNMSELSIQLLEKTEELYLHIIELKNSIQEKDLQLKQASELLESRLEKLENNQQL